MKTLSKSNRDIMALSFVPGLGAQKIINLLEKAKDTEEIFRMKEEDFRQVLGRSFSSFKRITEAREDREFISELEYIEKEGIRIVSYCDECYPEGLRHIYDPPVLLYYKGNLKKADNESIAIVGSRDASFYGCKMAESLASCLAERGVTIVSGMARGIDSAAHKGALKVRGRTIAVMGSSFRYIYPRESRELFRAICEEGAVVTEYPSGIKAAKWTFPKRNRIISGMAKGVVVAEAAKKSGAMITVDYALEEGREVFAVPARADASGKCGSNFLIQNGAKLVMNADDVLQELNIKGLKGNKLEEKILI